MAVPAVVIVFAMMPPSMLMNIVSAPPPASSPTLTVTVVIGYTQIMFAAMAAAVGATFFGQAWCGPAEG